MSYKLPHAREAEPPAQGGGGGAGAAGGDSQGCACAVQVISASIIPVDQ